MNIQLWLDLKTSKISITKPNTEDRHVISLELPHQFDVDFIVSHLHATLRSNSNDVVCIKIQVPNY